MATQPKSAKQLESELQVAQEAAKKIAEDLAEARKVEAEKAERLKLAAGKRAKKTAIKRKAEIETILIDYDDVVTPVAAKSSNAQNAQQPLVQTKSLASTQQSTPPAPKQNVRNQSKQTNPKLQDFLDGFWGHK